MVFVGELNLISEEISEEKLKVGDSAFPEVYGFPLEKAGKGEWLLRYRGDIKTGQSVPFRPPVGSRTRSLLKGF